eukprot:scaffold5838_cov106-Skeletonema_dohrnii-CCMP3373.AAC.1
MRRKHGSIAPSSLAAAAVGVQQIMTKMNNRIADQASLTAGERRRIIFYSSSVATHNVVLKS